MRSAASSAWIADAFRAACRDELAALKPGNVHRHGDGHRMTIADFEASADAAAPAIAESGARVGARILAAVEATFAAVGTNTNLGIVLLAAPLALAAERAPAGSLREALGAVLSGLDRHDAALAFRAIALANPAGLGRASAHDVHEEPDITLLAAMEAAAGRDRVAYQYASRYEDIFTTGLPTLAAALGSLRPWEERPHDRLNPSDPEAVSRPLTAHTEDNPLRRHPRARPGDPGAAISEFAALGPRHKGGDDEGEGDARRQRDTSGSKEPRTTQAGDAIQAALEAATTAVHMVFLSRFPDSHIARKHGIETAAMVQGEAATLVSEGRGADHATLLAFDAKLKARGLNPGTTADLTVTTLFAARLGAL